MTTLYDYKKAKTKWILEDAVKCRLENELLVFLTPIYCIAIYPVETSMILHPTFENWGQMDSQSETAPLVSFSLKILSILSVWGYNINAIKFS